jgi:hypothetical protein
MILLTTINDIRKYRQLGKQLNQDNFDGRVREVQENELTELLGRALSFDFFNYLDSNWTNVDETLQFLSLYSFNINDVDLSATILTDYALKINGNTFVKVLTCTFDGTDTIIQVSGYELPATIETLDYKESSNYVSLLNGSLYTNSEGQLRFNGLRPFIAWKLLAIFLTDGNVKHSDVGNISIVSPNFERPSNAALNAAKSTYLQNSVREENNIIDYLNYNSVLFPLWNSKQKENIENFNFIVI